jgi:RNA polymerase sigma-70 factor, ECF subfamily
MAAPRAPHGPEVADEALVRLLFAEHGRAMLGYAAWLTGDHAAAEDVVQEALVRVWRRPDSMVNGRGSMRGYLLTVVRHLVIDAARARGARPTEVAESPATTPLTPDHADDVASAVDVAGVLARLSPEHRVVLEELHLRNRTMTEAAAALGIPTGTVKSRSYKAVRALRQVLDADRDPAQNSAASTAPGRFRSGS